MRRVAGSTGSGTMRWLCLLCVSLGLLGFGERSFGQTVTAYDLRDNIPGVQSPNLRITALEDSVGTVDSNVAINFVGDGRPVNFLEVYFVGTNSSGVKNLWSPGGMDFHLTGRFNGTTTYQTSPLTVTDPGDWSQIFGVPSNSDWTTPLYTQDGWNVYRAEFLFPEMVTIPGQQHTITWSGYGTILSGGFIYALFSDNSGGSFGASSDWYYNSPGAPQSLTAGGAPFPTAAARVGYVPAPSSFAALISASVLFSGRRRRS